MLKFHYPCLLYTSGPLTSDIFAEKIQERCGSPLSFYDAAAPIVTAESIDMSLAFFATRYDKGEADYINCPMTKEEYEAFYNELVNAESVQLKSFENLKVYEGCMPVEVLAKRGIESVRYGCMKPVGLIDPRTDRRPYACLLYTSHYSGTLVNALMYHCGDSLSGINGVIRPGIVHRIDRDTSGLLIVAKNDTAHNILAEQIKVHSFTREYMACLLYTSYTYNFG